MTDPQKGRSTPSPRGASERLHKKPHVRSSMFKFYLHDSIGECRLELVGDVSEFEIPELNGCWHTAKTTLGSRRLVMDLRRVSAVDQAAKQWLAFMGTEGAGYLPENFLRNALAGKVLQNQQKSPTANRPGLLNRLLSTFRVRVAAAE